MSELTHDGLCHRQHHRCAVARLEALVRALLRRQQEVVGTRLYQDEGERLRVATHCDLCGATQAPEQPFRHANWCPYDVLDSYQLRDVLGEEDDDE